MSEPICVVKRNGELEVLDISKIQKVTAWACEGLQVSQSELEIESKLMFFDRIKTSDIQNALIKAAASLISVQHPDYSYAAARLLLLSIYKEGYNSIEYPSLRSYIAVAVEQKRLNPRLLEIFDFEKLDAAIQPKRDLQFNYLGLQTLADRYLIKETNPVTRKEGKIIELPQMMFMRVAMGLCLYEDNPTERAIEFYEALSTFKFMSSTPTLFNSGTNHAQLSSCYLNTVEDSIHGIFNTIHECANLSKYAGGIGTDWTRVRASGDVIVGTNGKSSGIVPYLKIFNDTAIAVNQSGKRNGAFAAYLEPWHPDLYDFCDLKKNSGDERRRAHDIFPALWCPDLFFKRVKEQGVWSFFSPSAHPDLHELYGEAFEKRYEELEAQQAFTFQKPALEVWKKILSSLFETGHPWITMKDEPNRRNPQDHIGVIHNSNLCTEISLNTSDSETAVCNLGSINLSLVDSYDDLPKLIRTAVRMLDNVIDINFYPSGKALESNLKHRPIGLGVMGYTEYLVKRGIDWESEEHLKEVDVLFEHISFNAIAASVELARERGAYNSFYGSKWSKGLMPIDTARDKTQTLRMEWAELRDKVATHGIRNCNIMAIAPTATISNIVGTTPCIEPIYKRQYSKSNLSGTFIVVDPCLTKYDRQDLCKEAFEIDTSWVIRSAAIRQKWIDQAQSVNIFVKASIKGSELSNIYMSAWELGLKTTYYLRSQSKSLNESKEVIPAADSLRAQESEPELKVCTIGNPDCESCQ